MQRYAAYFARKLDRWLLDDNVPPLQRLSNFVEDAKAGMARHAFRRGCLVGNLGQEISALPPSFRQALENILLDWQARLARCLEEAARQGQLKPEANPFSSSDDNS